MDGTLSNLGALFRRLECRDALPESERRALAGAAGTIRTFHAGQDIVREGDRPSSSTLLVRGLAGRYRMVASGGRQITALHVDGDFVDLHGFLLRTMDHGVKALSECVVVAFPHKALYRITETEPHLTRMLWLSTLLDGAIHREWLAALGRKSALQQMAHLFCEILLRSRIVERGGDTRYPFPITQSDLADAMGISPVHVNRTIQELRGTRSVEWREGWVEILDEIALRELGEFDETYLHLSAEHR